MRKAGPVGLLAVLILTACSDSTGGADPAPTPTTPPAEMSGTVDVFELPVGACLADADVPGHAGDVALTPCDESHRAEVYAASALDGGAYPADAAARAEQFCYDAFTEFVGVPLENSRYDFMFLYPTEEGWTAVDDRAVTCIATSPEDTTGSLSGRKQ